jgi:hypothetical protein
MMARSYSPTIETIVFFIESDYFLMFKSNFQDFKMELHLQFSNNDTVLNFIFHSQFLSLSSYVGPAVLLRSIYSVECFLSY